jgi:hypothetical protein
VLCQNRHCEPSLREGEAMTRGAKRRKYSWLLLLVRNSLTIFDRVAPWEAFLKGKD